MQPVLAVQRRVDRAPDIDLHQLALVGHRAADVGDELGLGNRGLAGPSLSSASVIVLPLSSASVALSRVALSVAALATMRAVLMALPSASSTAATPSAGQSSAEPVVTLK